MEEMGAKATRGLWELPVKSDLGDRQGPREPKSQTIDQFSVVFGPRSPISSEKSTSEQTDASVQPTGKSIERISQSERALP